MPSLSQTSQGWPGHRRWYTHHYLHKPVDPRCRPLAYILTLADIRTGCLVFGRPESTRCYRGGLTYGNRQDVAAGRAYYDYWEVLNLCRVWLHPDVQQGGTYYDPYALPGFVDRRGIWRSTLASTVIGQALGRVGFDYLLAHPPCFVEEPYALRAVLSYCDLSTHKGTIYRAAGFRMARTNERGIETWWTDAIAPLTPEQNRAVRAASEHSERSRRHRATRANRYVQEALL